MSIAMEQPNRLRSALLGSAVIGGYVLVASSAATQFIADRLNHHPALGQPLIGSFYAPWRWYQWQSSWWASNARQTFGLADSGLLAAAALGLAGAYAYSSTKRRRPVKHAGVHGTAQFQTEAGIRRSGLLAAKRAGDDNHSGVYIGAWKGKRGRIHYMRHDGPEHCIVIAPTRSGKGVGNIVPTLLAWPDSCVVYDEKGELWELTAGWRSQEAGQTAIRLELGGVSNTAGFNFLSEVRLGTDHEVADAQNIALMLCDPEGKGLTDHFQKTSFALIAGLILYVLYRNPAASLGDVAKALSDPEQASEALWNAMLKNTLKDGKTHLFIASRGRDMLDREQRERGSVLSSAKTYLDLFTDPLIQRNTSRSSFRLMDLMNHEKPVSLYIVTGGGDKERLRPLVRLLLTMMTRTLMSVPIQFNQGRPIMPHKHRLLMMLDEFPSLRRLPIIEDAMPKSAGYGIKFFLAAQDREQLYEAYGQHQTITPNCHIRIVYAPNERETAQWVSDMIGTTTIVKEDVTESGSKWGGLNHVSRTFHEVSRPLMTPDEIATLKKPVKQKGRDGRDRIVDAGDMIAMVAGENPIKGTQILYFTDAEFTRRAAISAPAAAGATVAAAPVQAPPFATAPQKRELA